MNIQDEYWFWVMKAVSEPDGSSAHYFYDRKSDELFAFKIHANDYKPYFRNESTKTDRKVKKAFSNALQKLKDSSDHIITLPKLSFVEKRGFLEDFANSISTEFVRKTLIQSLEGFKKTDRFDYPIDIKELDQTVVHKFDMEKGTFIAKSASRLFAPFGVSEKSTVIW